MLALRWDNGDCPGMLGRREQGASVFYIVESSKSFSEVSFDLEPVVQRLGFVVLTTHDLGAKENARHKEIELDEDCVVFEVANYRLTENLLAAGMEFSLLLPWRISIFTDNGATKIGVLRPTVILAQVIQAPAAARIAQEIEDRLLQIVDEVR